MVRALEKDGRRLTVRPKPRQPAVISAETAASMTRIMEQVVERGTGTDAKIPGYSVAGKTGTAQVISNEGKKAAQGRTERDLRDHGFFVFFAPRDAPEIAGIVFAEHGEHGSNAAAIARHVIGTYFAKKDGQPLPVLPPKPVLPKVGLPGAGQ